MKTERFCVSERFRPRSAFEASLRHPKWGAALLTVEQMRRPREAPRSHDLVADWNKFRISAAGSHELCTKPTVAFTRPFPTLTSVLQFIALPQNKN